MSPSVTFANAPLLELIVELRWIVDTAQGPPGAPKFVNSNSSHFDKWYSRFSVALEDLGYHHLERLIPHDFPPVVYQPIFRFKKKSNIKFPLVHFGHGIFTINAGPPNYVDWKSFRPDVEACISALLSGKPVECDIEDFSAASIRYIDAFHDELKQGSSNYSFMKRELQSSINLPESVFKLAADEDDILPTIALQFPIKDRGSTLMNLQVASGKVNNDPATIMEMSSITKRNIKTTLEDVLSILDDSQKILHETFMAMTDRIHDRMQPQK